MPPLVTPEDVVESADVRSGETFDCAQADMAPSNKINAAAEIEIFLLFI